MPTALAAPRHNVSFASESLRAHRAPEPQVGKRLAIKVGRQSIFIAINDLRWVQAARNYLRLYTGADYHLLRETMSHLEAQLDPVQFVRIHRCTIVNRDCVREVRHLENGQSLVVLDDQTVLRLSRGYRHVVNRFPRLATPAPAEIPLTWGRS